MGIFKKKSKTHVNPPPRLKRIVRPNKVKVISSGDDEFSEKGLENFIALKEIVTIIKASRELIIVYKADKEEIIDIEDDEND